MNYVIFYVVCINFLTFFAFGLDKQKSLSNSSRIRERTLWLLALLGGTLGALLGMKLFRHKTKKVSFQAGIIVICAVQILLFWFYYNQV